MKNDFIVAITQLAAEKNLPKDTVFEAVEAALASAYKKDNLATSNVVVKIDQETGITRVFTRRTVVEEVDDGEAEMTLDEAKKLKLDAKMGDNFDTEVMPENAGRIAAQTAKQVVLQRLREAEREVVYEEYSGREGDIVSGEVVRMEGRNVIIDMGKAEALLPTAEQVRGEHYRPGQRVKCYVLEVYKAAKGPQVIVSRANKHLIRRLFELEVPEIFKGIVEIKAIAREAGYRSKVSVWSTQDGVDPVGACVGLRALRIQNVVNELNGERIDVVLWDPEPSRFAAHALSPAQVIETRIDVETNTAYVVVPDVQLSLAIGKEGQNARLAAKLTGMRIDIKSQSVYEEYLASLSPEELRAREEASAEPAPAEAAPVEEAPVAKPAPAAVGERKLTPEEEAVLATKEEGAAAEEEAVAVAEAPATDDAVAAPVEAAAAGPAAPHVRFAEEVLPGQRDEEPEKGTGPKKGGPATGEAAKAKKQKRSKRVIVEEDDGDYEYIVR